MAYNHKTHGVYQYNVDELNAMSSQLKPLVFLLQRYRRNTNGYTCSTTLYPFYNTTIPLLQYNDIPVLQYNDTRLTVQQYTCLTVQQYTRLTVQRYPSYSTTIPVLQYNDTLVKLKLI